MSEPQTGAPSPSPPTLRTIAKVAGVSAATVSMALKNDPRIRTEVRLHIQNIARDSGYHSDPQLRRLMQHLRTARNKRIPGSICSLWTSAWPDPIDAAWSESIAKGAHDRARELGFTWDTIAFEQLCDDPQNASRKLQTLGVEGLFLPPVYRIRSLPSSGPWEYFSIVAASLSIPAPKFRRVIPNQFGNMVSLCRKLTSLGFNKIGLCIPFEHDLRQNHHSSGGFASFHVANRLEMLRPFLHESFSMDPITDWIRKERPDVAILGSEFSADLIRRELNRKGIKGISLAVTTVKKGSSWAGIDELPERVGSRAIDLLGGMILQEERGIPEDPSLILIDGIWQDGDSLLSKA